MNILNKSFIALILLLSIVNISKAQVYKEGNIIIDAYYGFPNLMFYKWNTFTSQYQEFSNARNLSIGPVGARVEYMLTEKIGIGIEGSYSYTLINYDFDNAPYELAVNRFRILPRFNLHFGKHTKADPYIAFGIGYYHRTTVFSPNNPAYGLFDPNTGIAFGTNWPFDDTFLVPVALTAKFGLRYFFNDHIGIVTEVGFGGPAASLGITGKF